LQRAWSVNADELELLANVTVPSLASWALSARIERPNRDVISRLISAYLIAHCSHCPRHFMTEDLRHSYSMIHVAVEQMEVGSTNAAI
jgi:hypothetical protein